VESNKQNKKIQQITIMNETYSSIRALKISIGGAWGILLLLLADMIANERMKIMCNDLGVEFPTTISQL
jgi:hypothetical protein